ncbi:FR47-like protein [Sarocladium implicatum]|nr:FR47-like protein [Sarocladium implicatum]
MADVTNVFTKLPLPSRAIDLLQSRLPNSLPLLRRLQSASQDADATSAYRIVLVTRSEITSFGPLKPGIREFRRAKHDGNLTLPSLDVPFTMAFVEFGTRPDTQMWIYSTFEDIPQDEHLEHADMYRYQMREVVQELKNLRLEYEGVCAFGQAVLLGSAHSRVMALLKGYNRYDPEKAGTYDKWLFRLEDVPKPADLPEGMTWAESDEEVCKLAISKATVPLPLETLVSAPSLCIKAADNTPVCWGFLAPDGSLVYLHCIESHRQKGLAKSLVSKLFVEKTSEFGTERWASADVHPENAASQALCRSLGGRKVWKSSWVLFDLGMRNTEVATAATEERS